MIVMVEHHIIQTLLYSLLLCLPSFISLCSLSIDIVFSPIKNQPIIIFVLILSSLKKLSSATTISYTIMAELTSKLPCIQEFAQKLNKSSPCYRELLKVRLLLLSTGLPKKKAAISYGGNILADIERIQTM